MKKTALAAFALLCAVSAHGQSVDLILKSIENNNIELKALRQETLAEMADAKADNMVAGPSAEFSPFWQKDVSGLSSSELVVSQEFDFPTLYSARSKSNKLQAKALDLQYDASRRDLMLDAKLKCIELIKLRKERELINARHEYAHRVLTLIEKMEKAGSTTALDANKTRMEHMSLEAAVDLNESQQLAIIESLLQLNGAQSLTFDNLDYPATESIADYQEFRSRAIASDPALLAALGAVDAARQDVSVSKQGWLPSLNVGFRRNAAPGEAQHGMVVGLSFPVWSTRERTRAARARQTAAELRADDAGKRLETEMQTQYNELMSLEKTIKSYDRELMEETLRLLAKAVEAGHITVLDYFNESSVVYDKLQELIDANFQYQTLMANLTKSTL